MRPHTLILKLLLWHRAVV